MQPSLLRIQLVCGLLLTLAIPDPAGAEGVPALYPTREAAEQAAKEHFNCSGAHRMGNQWMPCEKHPSGNKQPMNH
ncbi:MAG: DUF3721 domain-containing protein [Vulcanococcus sp.]